MMIYIAGPLGYETALALYNDNIVRIKKQFPLFFIKQFLEIKENMEVFNIEKYTQDVYIREIREGGLFGCLWQALEELGAGCRTDALRIPLNQETAEILEFFKENPYEVSSKGSFIIISKEPVQGAALIGFTDETRSRVVDFGNHKRFLTPLDRQKKDIQDRKGETK